MSTKKAITFDGFSDHWIHHSKNINFFNDIWNDNSIKKLGDKIFEARIIPLNKVWPAIPEIN